MISEGRMYQAGCCSINSRLVFRRCSVRILLKKLNILVGFLMGFLRPSRQTSAHRTFMQCHDHFFSNPFHFIIHHSFYHLKLSQVWQHHKINHNKNNDESVWTSLHLYDESLQTPFNTRGQFLEYFNNSLHLYILKALLCSFRVPKPFSPEDNFLLKAVP
jgi:hypothetical protein